jgi:Protein of unknown function (DUF1449)
MDAFLALLMSFPSVIFTGLLGLAMIYWLSVIIGALDIDLLSPDTDHDVGDAGGVAHASSGLLNFISVGKVPVTIIFTVFSLLSWFMSMTGDAFLRTPMSAYIGEFLYGCAIFPCVVILAFILTGFLVRPLRGIFHAVSEHGETALEGKMVRITSRNVSPTFGTATMDNAGAGILMNVICRDGVTLKRDDMAVVVEFDAQKQQYLVAPFNHTADALLSATTPTITPSTTAPPVSLERRQEPPQ